MREFPERYKKYIAPFRALRTGEDLSAHEPMKPRENARERPRPSEIHAAELDYICRRRSAVDGRGEAGETASSETPDDLIGLALSGGGIRSAIFSLGILQALSRNNVLNKVDYLSTVSGGGYIGSALTWLTRSAVADPRAADEKETSDDSVPQFDCSAENFPFGNDDPRPGHEKRDTPEQKARLYFLRDRGYYLTPGAGISAISLIGAVLRGSLLNLLVWLPIFVSLFMLTFYAGEKISQNFENPPGIFLPALFSQVKPDIPCSSLAAAKNEEHRALCEALAAAKTSPREVASVYDILSSRQLYRSYEKHAGKLLLFEVALGLGAFIAILLFAFLIVYSLSTHFSRAGDAKERKRWYRWRRMATRSTSKALVLTLLLLILGLLPLFAAVLHNWFAITGPIAVILGAGIAMKDFLNPSEGKASSAGSVLVVIGSILFLFGMTIICFYIARYVYLQPHALRYFGGVLFVSICTCWAVNLNYISIHRFYRDRLMEAFLPDIGPDSMNDSGMASGADIAYMDAFGRQEKPRAPYHIINTNVVLVNSSVPTYKNRGGDNFILSPLYCGSNATGWNRTDKYMNGRMTLPTAVAISGAAANPNTGVGGAGITRNLWVSLAMSLLNLRLGYWATRPREVSSGNMPKAPNHYIPGTYSFDNAIGLIGKGFNETRKFMQLSDGGHFENMALYELIRRKVRIAIVCDGGADKEFSFSDMQTTAKRVEEDFGTEIELLDSATPNLLVPDSQFNDADGNQFRYPKNRDYSPQGHMYGKITYGDGSTGLLIYMKTALVGNVSFSVKGYAALNPDFPDEPTSDQFFDNIQFDAYRELGYTIAENMLDSEVPIEIATDRKSAMTMREFLKEVPSFGFVG